MNEKQMVSEMIRVLRMEAESLQSCAARIEGAPEDSGLTRALQIFSSSLSTGGKIVVTGVGKSGKVAQKIAATLCSTGSLAVFLHPTEGLHGDLGVIQPGDSILALSYTGNTEEVVRLLPTLKNRGVLIVGLGGNSNSKLAESCDAWIDAKVEAEACPHNLAPTTSTTLALALGDALAVALMRLRGFEPSLFAKNHPGGSLGRRLHLQVKDLMHSVEAVAVLDEAAPMDQIVMLSTEKKMGAVLIVESQKLIGIITDGDLRRALKFQDRFFQFKARDVMTQNPVTIRADVPASEALHTMENRPSPISLLPVVNENQKCLGLIRLHDLVRTF
ncbi:MAG: KpsF/GutQ family sugar-phosphate isomerase [Bdellovibrionia bacterium]